MSLPRLFLSCSLIVFLTQVGCSDSGAANRQPTKPITVTVTYKGSPVAGATVSFLNEKKDAPAVGMTDAQGIAKMKTYVEGDGAVMGKHQVTISKVETSGPVAADQDTPAYVPPGENTPPTVVKSLIPAKYSNAAGGLTADVSASGPSEIKFELTD